MKYNQMQFTEEQVAELKKYRKINKDKNIDKRLYALLLRAEDKSRNEISELTGFAATYITELSRKYMRNGISAIVDNHYKGNRRNMSFEEEEAFLAPFKAKAEAGMLVDTAEIKEKYEELVGHSIGGGQIYYVLHRHGWRKVMPRSKHPNKASDESIEAQKKLNAASAKK